MAFTIYQKVPTLKIDKVQFIELRSFCWFLSEKAFDFLSVFESKLDFPDFPLFQVHFRHEVLSVVAGLTSFDGGAEDVAVVDVSPVSDSNALLRITIT